ncbi:MAG: response regulator [Prevotellaceae bacterium]|nr:response regulator [Candidatus Minthosoma equi]
MNNYIAPGTDVDSLSVLIVDDVPLNILLIKKMLSQYTFQIRTANGGQAALDAIAQKMPDLLLLDLMMPGIDGFEVIRRLRAAEATKELPIIILSALNSEQDIAKGFQLGANDFINKPIIMEKLLSSVTTQINLQEAKRKLKG